MASNATKPVSSIAMAFAGKTASLNISKPRDGVHPEGFHGSSAPNPDHHLPGNLPTPPNSLSPNLPPHKVRPDRVAAPGRPVPAQHVDSDIDLQDAVEHAASQDQPTTALSSAALSGLEAAGAITPALLAKHHLPEILLTHGPMAIRHVLSYLTQSVPGFSRIPPPKARRLVVSALEIRGGGGLNGEVEFEKIGWGRWEARRKGEPRRESRAGQQVPGSLASDAQLGLSPPASIPESYAVSHSSGLQIPRSSRHRRDMYSGGSWAGESMLSSIQTQDEDMDMAEHEADKMSLDGESDDSESMEDAPGLEMDDDDATDEEDWAAIGPDALREGSYKKQQYIKHSSRLSASRTKPAGGIPLARSIPQRSYSYNPQTQRKGSHISSTYGHRVISGSASYNRTFASGNGVRTASSSIFSRISPSISGSTGVISGPQDSQEREAVEALLRMGSM